MKNSYLITSLTIALLSASIGLGFLLEGDAEEPVNNKKNGHQKHQKAYPINQQSEFHIFSCLINTQNQIWEAHLEI